MTWAEAFEEEKKSHGPYLFTVIWDKAGRGLHADGEEASCCKGKRRPSIRYPYGNVKHLNTMKHFRMWCIENPTRVRIRFPSAVVLVAEDVLTRET